MKKNIASIDLGSNSCRLRIANEKGEVLYMDSKPTMLGQGLHKTGILSEESFMRGQKALSEFACLMKKYDVKSYRAITTEACRKALNGSDFIRMIEKETGIVLEIIDAKEEARLNLKGASLNAPKDKEYIALYDLGGASTEISFSKNDGKCQILHTVSIPWGARNAAEAYCLREFSQKQAHRLSTDIKKYVDDFMKKCDFEKYRDKCCLLATSSTPLRLCAMVKNDGEYSRDKNDGACVMCFDFDKAIDAVCHMDLHQRQQSAYIGEDRAPIFIAAGIIFQTIYKQLGFNQMIVSFKGAQDAIIEELCHG